MHIISKNEAQKRGLKRYFTGRPCPRGHVCERNIASRGCVQCAQSATREWRSGARDHLKAYSRSYARKNAALVNEWHREWRRKDPERTKQRKAAEYRRNKARYNASAKAYREANKELLAEAERRKVAANPERYSAYKRNYKARKKLAEGSHTAADIVAIFKAQRGRCGYCRQKLSDQYHVDHIIALFNGGSNNRTNLQILCGPCNNSKSAKDPIDFARSKGLLL